MTPDCNMITLRNAAQKFDGKQVKRFPKKDHTKNGEAPAILDVCGYLPVRVRSQFPVMTSG